MKRSLLRSALLGLACLFARQLAVAGPVVLNEIHYHPPDDQEALQWIELHNSAKTPVDLADWKFSKGIELKFEAGTTLPAAGFGVVVRDRNAFRARYGADVPILAEFKGRLKRGGERLQLLDATGNVADSVKFGDRDPWPLAPDGYGATLERIRAADPGDEPANWAPSRWGSKQVGGGSPGRANDSASDQPTPRVSDLKWESWVRATPNRVEWKFAGDANVSAAILKYVVVGPEGAGAEKSVAAQSAGGAWAATIPAAGDLRVVRFWVETRDASGRICRWPSTNEVRPALSYLSWKEPVRGTIGQLHLWDGGRVEPSGQLVQYGPARRKVAGLPKARGLATGIYLPAADATNAAPELRDFVRISARKGGWKVRFLKDAPLAGVRTANVIFEDKARFVLSEHLSYELFRRSKVMTPHSELVRWVHNGQSEGYHLMVEQPNTAFLSRRDRDTSGNLYKLLWYGQGLVGQHEKKNNPTTGHVDLKAVVQVLSGKGGRLTWEAVEQNFAVDPCVDYFVVSQCIQNWDGYFNNYFVYHAPGAQGRWELIPWDEDKTWGDYDGASARYDWFGLPLTYGMNGDEPPSGGGNWGGGGFGPGMWWRPGGWFSGPLLAQPEFRARYLKRLKEFIETEFTEAKMRLIIDDLAKRLEPEVRHRAEIRGSTAESLLRQFRGDMDSFRRQVTGRRAFLLKELAR
jgi:hypothetical protein